MSFPSDPSSAPPRPSQASRYYAQGQTIAGKYELVRPLGEGGMGAVWVALNVALETEVALKLIRADFDAEDAGERLLQEARAAARLGHRAICRVFDFGHTEQGDPFIVMELLEGETLAEVLAARGRVSPAKAIQTLLPVIDALATAHVRGIVHRDLKPENIFLARETRRTQPKVVDFGIAKVDHRAGHRTLTLQGAVLGSPGYMSPEQARGLSTVDHRSDIWAISVVLYECVTGVAAFQGDNYNALMRSIIEDPVVPTHELAAGDLALWQILERGLKKDPKERWESMRELGVELARWLSSHDINHDVCGEPLTAWLEETPPPASRDLLSVRPPAMGAESSRKGSGAHSTLGELPAAKRQSSSPGPESTSAVASSVNAPRVGRSMSSFVGAGVVFAAVAAVIVAFLSRVPSDTTKASRSAASSAQPSSTAAQTLAPPPASASTRVEATPVIRAEAAPTTPIPAPSRPQRSTARVPVRPTGRGSAPPPKAASGATDRGPDLKDPY